MKYFLIKVYYSSVFFKEKKPRIFSAYCCFCSIWMYKIVFPGVKEQSKEGQEGEWEEQNRLLRDLEKTRE